MAKRHNLLNVIQTQFEQQKNYMDKEGFFYTNEERETNLKNAYIKALKDDPTMLDRNITFEAYKESDLTYVFTGNVLGALRKALTPVPNQSEPVNVDVMHPAKPADSEPAKPAQSESDKKPTSEPVPNPSKPVQNVPNQQPKHDKHVQK